MLFSKRSLIDLIKSHQHITRKKRPFDGVRQVQLSFSNSSWKNVKIEYLKVGENCDVIVVFSIVVFSHRILMNPIYLNGSND